MTEDERSICIALGNVRYAPGTWDKRFGFSVAGKAERNTELTESQKEWIYRLLYKYRGQLPRLYNIHKGHQHCQKKESKTAGV